VLRYNQICSLPKANPGDLKFLRDWLDHDEGGHFFLQGREALTWDHSFTQDVVSVSGVSTNRDALAHWISDHFVPWYHRRFGHRIKVRYRQPRATLATWKHCSFRSDRLQKPQSDADGNRLWVYSSSTITFTVNTISTILAPLLPFISIFVLYAIPDPMTRLYAIMAFTTIFSIVLTVIARPSRTENFAATTA
jgi:hypothetical protein